MKVPVRDVVFLVVVLGGAGSLAAGLLRPVGRVGASPSSPRAAITRSDLCPLVARVDEAFRKRWTEQKLSAAAPAPELAVMRRLSLSLCGTVPSLEEIRRFEARPTGRRIDAWLDDLLARPPLRRLPGRAVCAGVRRHRGRAVPAVSPPPLHRLAQRCDPRESALRRNRPRPDRRPGPLDRPSGDQFRHGDVRPRSRAGPRPTGWLARVARAFLGVRLDCAQCHDHPFQPWKQDRFPRPGGVLRRRLTPICAASATPRMTTGPPTTRPRSRRWSSPACRSAPRSCRRPRPAARATSLPSWVVDPRNPNFARVTVNRVWALLFGRPLAEPVDDLPAAGELHPALIRARRRFRRARLRPAPADPHHRRDRGRSGSTARAEDAARNTRRSWAVFPMTRLRPEQVAGALFQSAIADDARSAIALVRPPGRLHRPQRLRPPLRRHRRRRVRRPRRHDPPAAPADERRDRHASRSRTACFTASSSIAELAPDDRKAVETAYLVVLTRRPTPEESAHFAGPARGHDRRRAEERLSDLYWTLLNTTEFSWNH